MVNPTQTQTNTSKFIVQNAYGLNSEVISVHPSRQSKNDPHTMQSSFSNRQLEDIATDNDEYTTKRRILKNPTTTNFMSRRQYLQTSPVKQ